MFPLFVLLTGLTGNGWADAGDLEVQRRTIAGITFEITPRVAGTAIPSQPLPPPSPHIRALGPQQFEVDRVLVKKYAYNVNALMKLAWVTQHKDQHGNPDGYRVGGIRPGSILAQGGLRSGDVVVSVNGRATRNMPQVLLAHSQLNFRNDFEVVILRRGKPMVFRYTIVR